MVHLIVKNHMKLGTMLPEKTRVVCNNHRCEVKLINENGFGEGREYVTNPPNAILDARKEPEFNLPNNACAYPFDNFNYYPLQRRTIMLIKDKLFRAEKCYLAETHQFSINYFFNIFILF